VLDTRRQFPAKGGPPPRCPKRLMSYSVAVRKPTTAQLRQVMNAGRSTRAPSRAASSTQPRQRLPANSRHQTTPPHGPSDPSSRARAQHTPPRAFGRLEPYGPCHSARETRLEPTMRRRRCVRPTSAIHISKTSTQVPLGYDDDSSWLGRFTSHHPLRPAGTSAMAAFSPSMAVVPLQL
jgi:hypothetical protein